MEKKEERRVECPRQHAHHLLFSLTETGDIAIKCRGCHEVYTIVWNELEVKRQHMLARSASIEYTLHK